VPSRYSPVSHTSSGGLDSDPGSPSDPLPEATVLCVGSDEFSSRLGSSVQSNDYDFVSDASDRFFEATRLALEEAGVLRESKSKLRRSYLSARLKALIRKRSACRLSASASVRMGLPTNQISKKLKELSDYRLELNEAREDHSRDQLHSDIEAAADAFRSSNSSPAWKFIHRFSHAIRGGGMSRPQPITHPTSKVVVESGKDVLEARSLHWGSLCSDEDNYSR
jgi:hypothetical protein